MKIITGPNASGKSVYLKQVGLIHFMAAIGRSEYSTCIHWLKNKISFVPADEASIAIFDSILTRVKTRDTVASNMSTFAIDLTQMAQAIERSTEKSLIIIDEFGKAS
jgi:DNA mismatch repair protein MSH5